MVVVCGAVVVVVNVLEVEVAGFDSPMVGGNFLGGARAR